MVRKIIFNDRVVASPECIIVEKFYDRYYAVTEAYPDVDISVLELDMSEVELPADCPISLSSAPRKITSASR